MTKAIIVTDEVYELLDKTHMIERDWNIEYKVDWADIRPYLIWRAIWLVMTMFIIWPVINHLEDSWKLWLTRKDN